MNTTDTATTSTDNLIQQQRNSKWWKQNQTHKHRLRHTHTQVQCGYKVSIFLLLCHVQIREQYLHVCLSGGSYTMLIVPYYISINWGTTDDQGVQ